MVQDSGKLMVENQPITKKDLDAALGTAIGGLCEWIAGLMREMTERMDELGERIEAKET